MIYLNSKEFDFKYGKEVDLSKIKRRVKRLPDYDNCLKEFLKSNSKAWEVELKELPSKKPRVVLSSLKWRIKNFPKEYGKIRAFMSKGKIYLERVEGS